MDERINDGGNAFPASHHEVAISETAGMSLRDWFAGQALTEFANFISVQRSAETSKIVAALCYQMADAMLAARTNRGEEDNG